ncbi:MAG: RNA polymerase sigma factor [Oscillospiraceae bacterium]|nr:RNA polymerase sigma factor [Oscillospiraceae bacterium]
MHDSNIGSRKDVDLIRKTNIVSMFNEIYDSTNKPILSFITARCGNTSDISDIFQDTYMELYQTLNKRGTEYITDGKALVFKIAKRKLARNYSLFKRLQIFVSMTAKNDDNEDLDFTEAEVDSFIMENSVVNQIMLENAWKFIHQKPAETEKIFYLFFETDMTIPEIAKELSMSESNVKHKLYRTIKELKNLLKGGEEV